MAGKGSETLTRTPNQQGETIQILGVAEVADRLGVPVSSVYERTRFRGSSDQAPLPHRKVGRYLKFLASEVDAWLLALPLSVNTKKRPYRIKKDKQKKMATAA